MAVRLANYVSPRPSSSLGAHESTADQASWRWQSVITQHFSAVFLATWRGRASDRRPALIHCIACELSVPDAFHPNILPSRSRVDRDHRLSSVPDVFKRRQLTASYKHAVRDQHGRPLLIGSPLAVKVPRTICSSLTRTGGDSLLIHTRCSAQRKSVGGAQSWRAIQELGACWRVGLWKLF